MARALGADNPAQVLIAGAGGTAQEIVTLGNLEPQWTFN
jgi:tRNA (cmo5U34)-methyltransferase